MWSQTEPETSNDFSSELEALIDEMRLQDFDSIRFATYRAACKLRFIQKKTNVHLVDIWNMIESFRENGLNAVAVRAEVKASRLELLLTSVFHNLNKRLPANQHIDTDKSIAMLLSFLIGAYDRQHAGRITVFAIKIALATICAGKLVDKLRYVFSQISDQAGVMEWDRFAEYLQNVLALTTAVFEAPTFGYTEATLNQFFKKDDRVTVNVFLDVLMSDPCPPVLMWLPLLHRMASVEHVYHPIVCSACQTRSFTGFRYKCQRCTNYQLCQNCFWRGRVSGQHVNEHEMKEYSNYKSPTRQLAHSINKSLRCIPNSPSQSHPIFPEQPQRPLDLANVVPTSSIASRHMMTESMTDWSSASMLPGQFNSAANLDDEHRLIARYAAKLSGRTAYAGQMTDQDRMMMEDGMSERQQIARLEEENGRMLREMAALEMTGMGSGGGFSGLPGDESVRSGLMERKFQLEQKMEFMQKKRRNLMAQLEQLMLSVKSTPGHESLNGIGNRVSNAFQEHRQSRAGSLPASRLQGDLLHAAEDITTNMSTFVKELDHSVGNGQDDLLNGTESN